MDRTNIIKEIMGYKEMRISDIAKKSGIPYTSVKSILNRGVEKANYMNICKICESLGITADELEYMTKNNPSISLHKIIVHSDKRLEKIFDYYNNMDEIGKNILFEQIKFLESKYPKLVSEEKTM